MKMLLLDHDLLLYNFSIVFAFKHENLYSSTKIFWTYEVMGS